IIVEGGLTLGQAAGDQQELFGPTLVNVGSCTLFGATEFGVYGGATIINQQNATLTVQGSGSDIITDGNATLVNQGHLIAAVGTGATWTENYLNLLNSGSALVPSGTLDLEGAGTVTGSFTADAQATLKFGHSAWSFNAGASVSGAGTVTFPSNYW